MPRWLVAIATALLIAGGVSAATVAVPTDDQLIDGADHIVLGTIMSTRVESTSQGSLFTVYTLLLEESLKGPTPGAVLEFHEFGGVAGGRFMIAPGTPIYTVGERYLIFLEKFGARPTTLALKSGQFRFRPSAGLDVFARDVEGFPLRKQERPLPNVRGEEEFLRYIRERVRLSASKGASLFPGSPASVGLLDTVAAASFSADQWSGGSAVDYSVSPASATSDQKNLDDFEQVIVYDSAICDRGSGECIAGSFAGTGTIAIAFYTGSLAGGHVNITHSDIVVQDGVSSATMSQLTYQVAITHEMGHTLGFRHSDQTSTNSSSCVGTALPCTTDAFMVHLLSLLPDANRDRLRPWDNAALLNNYATSTSFDSAYLSSSSGYFWHRDSPNVAWRVAPNLGGGRSGCATTIAPLSATVPGEGGTGTIEVSSSCSWTASSSASWITITSGATGSGNGSVAWSVAPAASAREGTITVGSSTFTIQQIAPVSPQAQDPYLLWRNYASGQNAIWYMDGTTRRAYAYFPELKDLNWIMVGSGDFNGDGKSDLLWRHAISGENAVWYMSGSSRLGYAYLPRLPDTNWRVGGIADFDRDGQPDLLWRNRSTGENAVWYMSGTVRRSFDYLSPLADTDWWIMGAGDFNGDSRPDVVWRNQRTGANGLWYLNGAIMTGVAYLPALPDLRWTIGAIGDYNRDGRTDLVWRHRVEGLNAFWYMNNDARVGYAYILTLSNRDWRMEGPN